MPIGIGEPLLATHLTLMSLVDRALQGSLDLRQANARVREARARRGISWSSWRITARAAGSPRG
jgi:outer membrane protein TolC